MSSVSFFRGIRKRGGCWWQRLRDARVACRDLDDPTDHVPDLGLRLVRRAS